MIFPKILIFRDKSRDGAGVTWGRTRTLVAEGKKHPDGNQTE
jgi:hypothetical protein